MTSHERREEHDVEDRRCAPVLAWRRPVDVPALGSETYAAWSFWACPLGPLLFENESSDARDHCANERTFLSYLRLSVYMAIVSIAIVLSFHLKSQPSPLELRMAKPLGSVFWALSLCCLGLGVGNYIILAFFGLDGMLTGKDTVNKYSRKVAIVQTGLKTQLVLGAVSVTIIGTCVVLLVIAKVSGGRDS